MMWGLCQRGGGSGGSSVHAIVTTRYRIAGIFRGVIFS